MCPEGVGAWQPFAQMDRLRCGVRLSIKGLYRAGRQRRRRATRGLRAPTIALARVHTVTPEDDCEHRFPVAEALCKQRAEAAVRPQFNTIGLYRERRVHPARPLSHFSSAADVFAEMDRTGAKADCA